MGSDAQSAERLVARSEPFWAQYKTEFPPQADSSYKSRLTQVEMKNKVFPIIISLIFSLMLPFSSSAQERLRMATTTSVQDSGLLDNLLPPFEQKFNIKVDVIAVGTGKALKLAENGDVDIVFVHDPEAEDNFIKAGFGINRQEVMYNDFVIAGPRDDPALIKWQDAVGAFKKISEKKCFFVSRGDESGTHKKEKQLWKLAAIKPFGGWYLEAGQGMGATLLIASEKRAYCLVDRATYNAYINKVELIILSFSDLRLINRYSVIAVNPKRNPRLNYNHALALIKWLISRQAQKIIAGFKKDGKMLFHPAVYTGD